jgi:O-antigen ligase
MPIQNQVKKLKEKNSIIGLCYQSILIVIVLASSFLGGDAFSVPFYIIQIIALVFFGIFFFITCKQETVAINYPKAVIFFFCFLAVSFLQCVGMSESLVKILSPNTIKLYNKFLPAGSTRHLFTFSIYSFATYIEIVKTIVFFILFFTIINTIRRKQQIKAIVVAIIAATVVITFFGIMKKYGAIHDIEASFGVFANKNYYAGFTLMIVPLCLGYAFSVKTSSIKAIFIFLAVILSASIVLSLSRAATVSLGFSVFIMTAYLLYKRREPKHEIAIILLVIVVCGSLLYFTNTEAVLVKFSKFSKAFDQRMLLYKEGVSIIKDYPLFGVGLGNYGAISGIYRTVPITDIDYYIHNDHLQFCLEAGLLGAAFYCLFFVFLFRDILKQLCINNDPSMRYIVLGGACGILGVIIHSFFEMLFPVPAIAFMFWIVLAVIYKAGYIQLHTENKKIAG